MKQSKALSILKSGRNVFLTGSAGAGKTYVLNQYIQYLRDRKVAVAVTASTGIASTHMNGMTIHAWSGIGVKNIITEKDLNNMKTKKYLVKNLQKVKVLVIDEISMLHKSQIEMVNTILQFFQDPYAPFGGIQIVFSGDFFQLPPVGAYRELNKDKFAFMSQAWVEAKLSICYLTEQHRQTDNELNRILNEIRNNQISKKSVQELKNATTTTLDNHNNATKLYTHNVDVDQENLTCLDNLKVRSKAFEAKTKGNSKLIETLKKSVLASSYLELKLGAKVMFVKNNYEKGYVNGSLGEITSYSDEGFPVVKLKNGMQITANPENWSIEDDGGKPLASYEQVPLRLAWAITVHKSQGVTLDEASIDLSKTFERGQGYVALSRLKDLNGLHLTGFNSTALEVDALALKADKRFQELSDQADTLLDEKKFANESIDFLKKCDGLTELSEIEKFKKQVKEKSVAKKSTHERTKELIEQGLSIQEIADTRGLTPNSIIEHILAISKKFPDVDVSRFRPEGKLIKKVEKAYNQVKEQQDGELDISFVSLKLVFELLKKQVSYDNIKLCMVFF